MMRPSLEVLMPKNSPPDCECFASSFVLMYKQPKDAARTKTALDFFKWALEKGQQQAKSLDYVPLPDPLVKQIGAYWASTIK